MYVNVFFWKLDEKLDTLFVKNFLKKKFAKNFNDVISKNFFIQINENENMKIVENFENEIIKKNCFIHNDANDETKNVMFFDFLTWRFRIWQCNFVLLTKLSWQRRHSNENFNVWMMILLIDCSWCNIDWNWNCCVCWVCWYNVCNVDWRCNISCVWC